jgi:hypothetical protein
MVAYKSQTVNGHSHWNAFPDTLAIADGGSFPVRLSSALKWCLITIHFGHTNGNCLLAGHLNVRFFFPFKPGFASAQPGFLLSKDGSKTESG